MMINKVIMVVDDEMDMLMLLELLLKKQGYAVIKAQDAATALRLIDSLTPSLFILDVMMPGMDGFELCGRIRTRSHTAKTPVIIFSAWGDSKSPDRAFAVGANTYLPKASLPGGLINEIRYLLGQAEYTQQ